MYTSFYKLSGKPFQLSPNPRFFYSSQVHQKAMAYLRYGIHQGDGFIVITGDIGTGKTTLLGHLLEQLDSSRYLAAKLVTTQIEADDTLRMVASAFDIPTQGVDKATLLRRFETFLLENQRRGRRVLVLVDEVQNLPMRSLEELRMLSNFQARDTALIQFCLLGQPQFQGILASSDLLQLRQRVIASYHLGPLSAEETQSYVEHRLRLVNWQRDPVFTPGAFRQIHQLTSGVPREVNTLCDRLLVYGMLEQVHEIDEKAVNEVGGELYGESARAGAATAAHEAATPAPAAPQLYSKSGVRNTAVTPNLEDRVGVLEGSVKNHDRMLRRAIDLLATYLVGATEREAKEMSKDDKP